MKKIKIVGALIFIVSLTLAVLFNYTSKESVIHNNMINTINEQKAFTQDISKDIFYIYKNKESSMDKLDKSINSFLHNMSDKWETLQLSDEIVVLWNEFYLYIQHFRDQSSTLSPYSNILLEKSVKNIYNTNLKLIVEFDKLIKKEQTNFYVKQNKYKALQYALFFILVLLLVYLFTQLKSVIAFIQKFLLMSKNIITNSTIKELKPIEVNTGSSDISEAKDNFNTLVKKINASVEQSSNSIEHSYRSLEIVEQHVEELIELIYKMSDKSVDKELTKKEDAIIQSLEELSSSAKNLKNIKSDLDNLISHLYSNKT